MNSIADTLWRRGRSMWDQLTDEDKANVHDVLAAAMAWSDGKLPLTEFMRLGFIVSPLTTKESPPYTRFVALMTTPPDHPAREALLQACAAIVEYGGTIITPHGMFEAKEFPHLVRKPPPMTQEDLHL